MQPLVSPVDHESRRHDEVESTNEAQEYTPLLRNYAPRRTSKLTTLFVTTLMLALVFGVVVSLFLLLEEDRQWPVNIPFEMTTRSQWNAKPSRWPPKPSIRPATHAIVLHTGTAECHDINRCMDIVQRLQDTYQSPEYNMTDIPFNFLVSGNGLTYEGRGWDAVGEIDTNLNPESFNIAAIGNFTEKEPSSLQLQEIKALLDESIWRRKLSPYYMIVGRSFRGTPTKLFNSLRKSSHWRNE